MATNKFMNRTFKLRPVPSILQLYVDLINALPHMKEIIKILAKCFIYARRNFMFAKLYFYVSFKPFDFRCYTNRSNLNSHCGE